MSFDPNSGIDTGWLTKYYDASNSPQKPVDLVTPENCVHNGKCVWDRCPKCKKRTLHKYVAPRGLRIMDIEKCESSTCTYVNEVKIMGR